MFFFVIFKKYYLPFAVPPVDVAARAVAKPPTSKNPKGTPNTSIFMSMCLEPNKNENKNRVFNDSRSEEALVNLTVSRKALPYETRLTFCQCSLVHAPSSDLDQ
ncbi:hypothetical protein GWI33_015574 [Rhynchophorus ferrugineus]|uniref:Uncharacterized protein n=1 Tax=Rhynchophorus ferrugineus TaxID=354439 RepID=A0A834M4B9_RHYFE|nr:hypothetical protein GWI33_015574 [Rhynchophorus ferrugineus]